MKSLESIDFEKYHPVKSAFYLAGLLIDIKYQANIPRISCLLEFVMANFNGEEIPSSEEFSMWINDYDPMTVIKHKEDPCEDVYVSKCVTQWGDYRIFNGKWNSNEHYLRVLLDAICDLPSDVQLQITSPIKPLLALSELIADRVKAELYKIPEQLFVVKLEEHENLSRHLVFDSEDLRKSHLNFDDFRAFIFDLKNRERLNHQHEGNTDLERRPLILLDDKLLIIRPTEIGIAIKRYIIEWCILNNFKHLIEKRIVKVHLDRLASLSLIDGLILKNAPLIPQFLRGGCLTEVNISWGKGRMINVIILIDNLEGVEETGFSRRDFEYHGLSQEIQKRVQRSQEHGSKAEGFKEGVQLIFLCGYGRASAVQMKGTNAPGWTEVFLTCYDAAIIQYLYGFPTKSFWRLNSQLEQLERDLFKVLNLSGFLNLYGWWLESGKMLLSKDFEIKGQLSVMIPTDCIAEIRRSSLIEAGFRSITYIDGYLKEAAKMDHDTDARQSDEPVLYLSNRDVAKGIFLCCALTKVKPWWVRLKDFRSTKIERDIIFKLWNLSIKWMVRISWVLEEELPINGSPVQFLLDINNVVFDETIIPQNNTQNSVVDFAVDHKTSTVTIILSHEFMSAVYNPINIAERAVVRACIIGYCELVDIVFNDNEVERLCDRVVVNTGARHFHVFATNSSTNTLFLRNRGCTTIEEVDWSFVRLRLGNHKKESGKREITGKENCTKFLATTVSNLYDQLTKSLAVFNRKEIITAAFENICGIEFDRGTWKRTARAMMSLRVNLDEYVEERSRRFEELTVADISSRILIEIAVCVSNPTEGRIADKFDLSQLMALAGMIFLLGNRSDGIGKGIDDPRIEIAGNGEILLSHDLQMNVVAPILTGNEKDMSVQDSEDYESLFDLIQGTSSSTLGFSNDFSQAFTDEFGVSIEDMLEFAKGLDKKMAEKNEDIFFINRNQLQSYFFESRILDLTKVNRILDMFSLEPRANYATPPDGYFQRDIKPWLFRRRISLLFRPMVKLDNSPDELFVVVPDYFFKSFQYVVSTYQKSNMDPERCRSEKMKSWIGAQAAISGLKFNRDLGNELESQGYEVIVDTLLSSLLHPTVLSGKNYGDFDVIAWKKGSNALFLIECKDLFFAKTLSEMADQMLEYRGEMRGGKPDKLKKHIDRVKIFNNHKDRLLKSFDGLLSEFSVHAYVVFSKRVSVLYDKTYKGPVKFSFLPEVKEKGLSDNSPF